MNIRREEHRQNLLDNLQHYAQCITAHDELQVEGRLTRVVGLTLEATGCYGALGTRCLIKLSDRTIEAEIIGFGNGKTFLMAVDRVQGLKVGASVINTNVVARVAVSQRLLGRIIDGLGNPLDGKPAVVAEQYYPILGAPINPLSRHPITQPLDVGIQAINTLLTIGCGQRIGLFAGSGVGKSVLLGMMTRYTEADIVVVAMVGERGREVKEFIENNLGADGLARSVVVATPADNTPLMRYYGALLATTIAEYFRDQGKKVLLLMDSLTRFAQAQREIALAAGEPPASKGYTPSVFTKLAELVERAGNGAQGGGSITAFYTVLAEGDDQQDPVVDAARAILDGHIVLTRSLAEAGHFPAIDIEASLSRVMSQVILPEQRSAALRFRQIYSKYQQNRDLVTIGAYVRGSDPELDLAIQNIARLQAFLQQNTQEAYTLEASVQELLEIERYLKK